MKIGGTLNGFFVSAKGMSIQRKKMNLIAENIANADMIRTENGEPYKRKTLQVVQKQSMFENDFSAEQNKIRLQTTNSNHIPFAVVPQKEKDNAGNLKFNQIEDQKEGEILYMPDHPNANEKGYVELSNVNIINEMVDMIAASRSYEANLTAFNSSKQMAKDSLEI